MAEIEGWMCQFLYFTAKGDFLVLFTWIWVETHFTVKSPLNNLFQVVILFSWRSIYIVSYWKYTYLLTSSSAKCFTLEEKSSTKSLIWIKNNSGYRIDPFETRVLTLIQDEFCPLSTTLCFLFLKKSDKIAVDYQKYHFASIWK